MKKYYYAFRFYSGHSTTTGQPNERTGHFNIAGEGAAFKTKLERDEWINREERSQPSGLGGGERVSVTKKQLRSLCLGMSVPEFNEYIEYLQWCDDLI